MGPGLYQPMAPWPNVLTSEKGPLKELHSAALFTVRPDLIPTNIPERKVRFGSRRGNVQTSAGRNHKQLQDRDRSHISRKRRVTHWFFPAEMRLWDGLWLFLIDEWQLEFHYTNNFRRCGLFEPFCDVALTIMSQLTAVGLQKEPEVTLLKVRAGNWI